MAGAALVGGGDLQSIAGAFGGLLLGGWLVRLHSKKSRNDLRYNPVLVDTFDIKLEGGTSTLQVR